MKLIYNFLCNVYIFTFPFVVLSNQHSVYTINSTLYFALFVQRLELKTLSLSQFLDFVKNKIIVQKAIAQSKGQMNKFYSVWKPFLSLLEKL